jgi:hypothetical protein
VHFDPVESDPSTPGHRDFAADKLLGRNATREGQTDDAGHTDGDDQERDEQSDVLPGRSGLPPRFRMRHSRHYVDELLGDEPLRTVRQIPVSEIEPPDEGEELDEFANFESSIRRLGVLEPLLVGRSGTQYRVIAGMRRLRAAHKLGLGTVPCLVHEVDADKLKDMREAAMQRLVPAAPEPRSGEEVAAPKLQSGEGEPESRSGGEPAAPQAHSGEGGSIDADSVLHDYQLDHADRLRWAVLTDLAGVELLRAKTLTSAREILAHATRAERAPVDCASLVADAVAMIATEARLRAVRIEVTVTGADLGVSLDAAQCRAALSGLLQALIALAPREGTTLAIQAQVTTVRPAFIVQCVLKEGDKDLSPELTYTRPGRFFDPDWRDHPCGSSGAQMLAATAKVARLHGGRADVQSRPSKGCAATFVVPRPLTDL